MFVKSTQGGTHTALIGQLGESPFRTITITTTMLLNSWAFPDQHSLSHIALGPVSTVLIGQLGVSIRKYVTLRVGADMLHWFAKCIAVHSEITVTRVMSLRFHGFWDISISRNYNQILSFKLCDFWVISVSRNYISILSLGLLDFSIPCNCHVTGEAQYLRPVRCPSYLNDNARMHKKFDVLRVTLWPWGLHQMDMHLTTDLTTISTMCLQLDLCKMSKTL